MGVIVYLNSLDYKTKLGEDYYSNNTNTNTVTQCNLFLALLKQNFSALGKFYPLVVLGVQEEK